MIESLFIILGGFINRLRGGYPTLPSTFLARSVASLSWGLLLFYLYGLWYLIPLGYIVFYLGIVNGWGTFMDMGRTTSLNTDDDPPIYWIVGREDNTRPFWKRWLRDFIGMSLRGVWLLLPTYLLLWYLGPISPWWPLYGLGMSIWYELDHRIAELGWFRELLNAEFMFGMYLVGVLIYGV